MAHVDCGIVIQNNKSRGNRKLLKLNFKNENYILAYLKYFLRFHLF